MESDRILMAAGVTVAAAVGAFVFWGHSGSSRLRRRRRGQIVGLQNFGQSCFLNTLLQALAACPQFIAWLQLYNNASPDRKSLIASLLNTLEAINGKHTTFRVGPYSPGSVLRALKSLGWSIPQGEHDAHELFHIMLSTLEEEAHRPKQGGSLVAALPGDGTYTNEYPNRIFSAMMSGLSRMLRLEAYTADYPPSICGKELHGDQLPASSSCEISEIDGVSTQLMRMDNERSSRLRDNLSERASGSCRSLERLTRAPVKVSTCSDQMPAQVPHSFEGAIGTQIVCKGCGFKSTVRYDKFDSITLNLPPQPQSGLSLGQLLSDYIQSEDVAGVKCETCNESTTHTKSLTFAKLPACLCVHIARTEWLPTGRVCKRSDYVHFSECLSMGPYSFVQPHLYSQADTPWGSTMSLLSSRLPTNNVNVSDVYGSIWGEKFPRNLYCLLAVVVHWGEAHSGHFVTYRRGALRNGHKWFYTSDTDVREVSLEEVLSVPAYLIFYDCSPQQAWC